MISDSSPTVVPVRVVAGSCAASSPVVLSIAAHDARVSRATFHEYKSVWRGVRRELEMGAGEHRIYVSAKERERERENSKESSKYLLILGAVAGSIESIALLRLLTV